MSRWALAIVEAEWFPFFVFLVTPFLIAGLAILLGSPLIWLLGPGPSPDVAAERALIPAVVGVGRANGETVYRIHDAEKGVDCYMTTYALCCMRAD